MKNDVKWKYTENYLNKSKSLDGYFLLTNNEILNVLANRIKTVRIEQKLSQEELSRHSGVSVHTISNIEKGQNYSVDNLISILRSLNLLQNLTLLVPDLAPNPYDIAKPLTKEKECIKRGINEIWCYYVSYEYFFQFF